MKNNEKNTTQVQAIDASALKKALNVRSTVRAGVLVVAKGPGSGGGGINPPLCLGCGRGL